MRSLRGEFSEQSLKNLSGGRDGLGLASCGGMSLRRRLKTPALRIQKTTAMASAAVAAVAMNRPAQAGATASDGVV
jgi:hypothetical protein